MICNRRITMQITNKISNSFNQIENESEINKQKINY